MIAELELTPLLTYHVWTVFAFFELQLEHDDFAAHVENDARVLVPAGDSRFPRHRISVSRARRFSSEVGKGDEDDTRGMEVESGDAARVQGAEALQAALWLARADERQLEDEDAGVSTEYHETITEEVEKQHLGIHFVNLGVIIVQLFEAGVHPDFILKGGQIVATHYHKTVPPNDSPCHNEVFFLGLVSEETPFAVNHGIVGEPCSARHGYPFAAVVYCGVLKRERP